MFFATASRRHGLARWIPSLVRVGGVALAYYAAAAVSHSLALIHGNVSPLWIPSGIGLGALLVLGPRVWPGVGLGAFLANLATGAPPTFVLPVTLGNTGEALLAWRLLAPRPTGTATGFDLGALRRLLVAALTGALVSTVVGVAALRAAGMVGAGQGAVVGSVWWLGNVLGMLVIAPVLMAPWRGPAFLARRGWPVEAMLLLAGLVLIALVMVRRDLGYAYAVFPLLIWAAVRFEIIGATAAALLAALLAAWATGAGQSPFAVDTARGSLLPLQAYLTVVAGTALALAAALEERRLAEERLRQAGETQRALIDASPLAIVAVDERDRVLLWNPAAERLFGHRAAEVIGRPDPTVPPELAGEAEALRREALDRGADRLLETRRRRADGSLIDVQVSAAPFRDAAGVPIGTVAFLADLTEAKRAAEERERLVAMLEATPDFVGMADATGKALYINRAGRRMIGLPADAAVAGLTFRDFHPAWAADRVLAEGLPTAVRDGAWTGETALRTAEGREVPVSQALLAHHDADGRVVFFSTILRDLSDRIAAERALRESEERYRTLVNALPIAVVVQHGGKIAFCNPAAVQLLRAGGAEDLIGRPVLELVHPDDRESAPERADLLLGGGVAPAQAMRLVRLDGTEVHVEITSIPLPVGDDPGVLAMLRDVSERRRAEEALRRSEQRLRAILEAEPECVKLVGPDHTLHDMNQAGLSMIEADSLDAVRGCRLDQVFVVPEHRETFRAAVDRVLAGERGRLEFEIEGLKGTRRWLETHAVPYVDPVDGTRLVLAITRDITERKRTEQALRESEERQRLALTAAQLGTWRHDLASDEVRLDARAREHYDLDSEVVPFPEVLARVHPDDVRRLADAMARALDPAGRGPVEIEYRVVRRDGTVRWLSIHGQVEFESTSGRARAVRGIGTTQDITERKEAEAALRRSEERLRLALAGARAGVWDIQLQPRSIYWSEEYRALYGFSPDEPESDAKWAERIHPEDLPRLQENIRAMLQSTRSGWRQEFRIRHPARGERWILDLVRIRRDAAGRALSFGGINLDITDRKRVEQDLAARRAQLQLIADTAPVLIAHCDAARRYRFVNRAYAERF
ncbi:MAG TPA: PAS domain S-box protein, partial [Gemmatimonadales bacterium]|nr:PAS domain S-box protein [Gemmatimonadales bacterium]